ncbi:MAG TPA: hypothetical protein VJ992_07550 [Gemmatimonadales bacterium]|nr:hypothetical protein [Gemmatimonadales bacterium]
MRSLTRLCAFGLGVALCGCRAPAGPSGSALASNNISAMSTAAANGFAVTTLRLRSPIGGASRMSGVFHATFGTFFPPSPCVSTFLPAVQSVALCTVINDPDGELLEGGEVALHPAGSVEPVVVRISAAYPPSPCVSYLIRGSVPLPASETFAPDTPISASFFSDAGTIVTVPPGRPVSDFDGTVSLDTGGTVADAGPITDASITAPACVVTVGSLID